MLINTMLCPIKVNSNTILLTVHTSCYRVLDLLCFNSGVLITSLHWLGYLPCLAYLTHFIGFIGSTQVYQSPMTFITTKYSAVIFQRSVFLHLGALVAVLRFSQCPTTLKLLKNTEMATNPQEVEWKTAVYPFRIRFSAVQPKGTI